MELRDRLARLGYFAGATAPPDAPGQPATEPGAAARVETPGTPERREAEAPARRGVPDLPDLIDGAHRQGREGSCFVAAASYPLDHAHGGIALSDLLGLSDGLAVLAGNPRLADVDPSRTVVVDLETTGLAGGTGTWAFLVGLGYFADGRFRIEQFFLRDPSEERAMLGVLGDVLGQFEAIITFNGKCFDWPLLETRHVAARVALRPAAPLHVDLLHGARRLYRRRLGSCTLEALEAGALGLPARVGDVPGWLIPTLYFAYLRERDGRPLVPVLEHNRRDVLSMLALAVRLARHVADPVESGPEHPIDRFSLGRWLEDLGAHEQAVRCYERALQDGAVEAFDRAEALVRLAGAYKRLRDRERAVALWEALVHEGAGSIYPYVELAKHLEHRRRDFARAAELTREAVRRHEAAPAVAPGRHRTERQELTKRLARLERKLGR